MKIIPLTVLLKKQHQYCYAHQSIPLHSSPVVQFQSSPVAMKTIQTVGMGDSCNYCYLNSEW